MNLKFRSGSLAFSDYNPFEAPDEERVGLEFPGENVPRAPQYAGLIRRLLRRQSALAVIGASSGSSSAVVCQELATELAAMGNRVLIARLENMGANPGYDSVADCEPTETQNVWRWPAQREAAIKRLPSSSICLRAWSDSLRGGFDSVLFDCPTADVAGVDLLTRLDSAVLVVEANRTSRNQLRRDVAQLRLRGFTLSGFVYVERRGR